MKKAHIAKIAIWMLTFSFVTGSFFVIAKIRFPYANFFKEQKLALGQIVKYFPFSKENSLKEWEEKILKGRVVYVIEKGEDLSYVRAKSKKTASALYYRIKLDVSKNPVIGWKWRVEQFPERSLPEKIEDIKEEDFAARVYVIFPAAFFTGSKVIEYIWSETMPAGTSGTSGYSENIKVLVLQTGLACDWRFEERNICADYAKLFGERPRLNIGAIAFMTDADSTKTSAEAVYDEIEVGYK